MITVVAPATNRKLTTISAVKAFMGITDDTYDETLNVLIIQASAFIESYTNRIFAQQTYLEALPGSGGKILLLTHAPIVEVESVTFDDEEVEGYEIYDAESAELYLERGWTRSLSFSSGIAPILKDAQQKLWRVQYIAGYKLPGEKDRNLPAEVEFACIQFVKDLFYNRSGAGRMQSEKIGDYSVSYNNDNPLLEQLLQKWIRTV